MTQPIHVGLVGQRFMGRAHSNALSQVGRFFELPLEPVKRVVAGRDAKELAVFARRWGWRRSTTRWRDLAEDPEIGLVDVATPNHLHAELSIAMLEAGKHVACEKPLAGTLADARAMRDAARRAKRARTFVWFNYRRCPAVALAWQLVRAGRIGRIYHVRATYLQSWGGPATPLSWRFERAKAGSGAHGDLNAHVVDLARFLSGEEIVEVHGAVARTFIEERAVEVASEQQGERRGARARKTKTRKARKKGKSTVDDATLFLASLEGGGIASFEATRLAAPHQNACSIELDGEKGSLRFDFEDMNLLRFHDAARGPREGGWTRIMCTSAAGGHPYARAWWPDAHLLGYEHGFTNMLADVLRVLGGKKPELPLPDFEDAYRTQRVLAAALLAAKERRAVRLSEVE
jgi:predicted dehydrogenase